MITYIADLFSMVFYGEPMGANVPDIGDILYQLWKNLLNLLNGFGGGTADIGMSVNWLETIPVLCAWIVTLTFAFGFVNLLLRLFRIIR